MKKSEKKEKLKRTLFKGGYESIRAFCGDAVENITEKDALDNLMEQLIDQMPKNEFDKAYKKYASEEKTEPKVCTQSVVIESDEDFKLNPRGLIFDGILEFSTDGVKWNEISKRSIITSENGKLCLRGRSNTVCYLDEDKGPTLIEGQNLNVLGDIMTLLDYGEVQKGKQPVMEEDAFAHLFARTSIVDASKLELPASNLTPKCFYAMFSDCISLERTPKLPATILSDRCYHSMFLGCTGLVDAPQLPATTLAQSCYSYMFSGCTSLVNAPSLPATTLASYCYSSMFSRCTSLVSAPELPATTLEQACYFCMFNGCTSLTAAPSLPATTLATESYSYMFKDCISLLNAPQLLATNLAIYCYYGMFSGCTSLTAALELPAMMLAEYCYAGMFFGCTSLTTAPVLPATTLVKSCYFMMFENCTSLASAPELSATTLAMNCYYKMFSGCTGLTSAPKLPATSLAARCYESMFENCTSLASALELPATTLAENCYYKMFLGCTGLERLPKFPLFSKKEDKKIIRKCINETIKQMSDDTFLKIFGIFSNSSIEKDVSKGKEETLTAGLLRDLIGKRNIPELSRLVEGVDDNHRVDLKDLDSPDTIAWMIWTTEDIRDAMCQLGYPLTEENLSAVLHSGELKNLSNCTDGDWEIISNAIRENAKRNPFEILYEIKKLYLIDEAEKGTQEARKIFEKRLNSPSSRDSQTVHDFADYLWGAYESLYDKVMLEVGGIGKLDALLEGDYEAYTEKHYGRKFWNEIENPAFLDDLLDELTKLIPSVKPEGDFCLSLYDFHNADLYFASEEDVNAFVSEYDVAPATLFRKENGSFVEEWNI